MEKYFLLFFPFLIKNNVFMQYILVMIYII